MRQKPEPKPPIPKRLVCTRCDKEQPIRNFYRESNGFSHRRECKHCNIARMRARREEQLKPMYDRLLAALVTHGALTAGEAASIIGIARQRAGALARNLLRDGRLERYPHPECPQTMIWRLPEGGVPVAPAAARELRQIDGARHRNNEQQDRLMMILQQHGAMPCPELAEAAGMPPRHVGQLMKPLTHLGQAVLVRRWGLNGQSLYALPGHPIPERPEPMPVDPEVRAKIAADCDAWYASMVSSVAERAALRNVMRGRV